MPFAKNFLALAVSLVVFNPAFATNVSQECSCSSTLEASNGTSFSPDGITTNIFNHYNLPYNTLGATVFALLYGSPLVPYNSTGLSRDTNTLRSAGTTDTANNSAARPNADTVYQKASLDLSQQNLVLTVPPYEPDRFYSFDFYDPFETNFANIGVVDKNPPGDYLIRPALYSGTAGLATEEPDRDYAGCIASTTLDIRLLNRVELKNSNDSAYVDGYLNQVKLRSVPRSGSLGAPLNSSAFENLPASAPAQVLQLIAILGSRNPPQNVALAKDLPCVLSCAGINLTNQTYTAVPGVDLMQAEAMWNAILEAYKNAPGSFQNLGNGWTIPNAALVGNWANGTAIVARSYAMTNAQLWNVASQAIYPFPVNRTFAVPEDDGLLLTFVGGKPPIASDGFWSLTIYHAEGQFIANPLNIYDVSSLGNLTYPDGTFVYGINSNNVGTTPFQVLIQSVDVTPPANWTGNWLPGPASGETFSLTLRFYAESAKALNGGYQYPVFETVPAIRS